MKVGEDFHCPSEDWDRTGGGTDPDGEEDERPQTLSSSCLQTKFQA